MTTHGYFAPAIEAQHLTKQYGAVRAVSDLSFVVPRGSITGFLGPNGSGKTTTLRMLLGLSTPSSGVGLVSGAPFSSLTRPARTVGAVLDSLSMHPKRSALAHLRIYTAAIGVPDSRAHDVLALVGLSDAARRPAGQFSLGMRQRLALATALLGDPEILVLDEPANGLDPEGIAWLRDFLKAYAAGGRTVLISSHILREVEQTVDSLVIVSAGSLVYQGTIEQLRATRPSRVLVAVSDPAAMAVSLASTGITDVQILPDGRLGVAGSDAATISAVADSAGLRVFGTTSEHVDLEQVFLSMTSGQFQGAPIQGPGFGQGSGFGQNAGFGQGPPPGYAQPGYAQPGYAQPGYAQPGYGPAPTNGGTTYGPGYGPPPPPQAPSPWSGDQR